MDARLSRDMDIEDFVTVILAEFAPAEVRIVNCGHHPPVKRVVRILLEHAGGELADDILLVLCQPQAPM